MNKTYFFRFVLIALFLLAYQSSTVHSSKHLLQAHNDCDTCVSSQQFEESLHKSTFPIIIESHNIESAHVEQNVVLKKRLDLLQKPLLKRVDLSGMQKFCVKPISLGTFANAPPYHFS